jgi:predicted 3-demethylubiquinone-9 3-methyltransferase (glyoxalase superfamily)
MIMAILPLYRKSRMQKILPVLWFEGNGEEALSYYKNIFPNANTRIISRYPANSFLPEGEMMVGQIEIFGHNYGILNGGPHVKFNDAVSFLVVCENQEEIDNYWNALTQEGQEVQCGWLKDKYGVSWQIVPRMWMEICESGDGIKNAKGFGAIMKMKKIIIQDIKNAINS